MRQTIERQILKAGFVPNTGGTRAEQSIRRGERPRVAGVRAARGSSRGFVHADRLARLLQHVASTAFWAVAGERTFARAVSQTRLPAALVNGSLAAGAAYMQERAASGTASGSLDGVSKRSLFSFYAAIGLGLGIGATLVNRIRR